MSFYDRLDDHDVDAVGACLCGATGEWHCPTHDAHKCECCQTWHHVDVIAECWPGQWWCPSCVRKNAVSDEWDDATPNTAELARVGIDFGALFVGMAAE